MVPDAGWRRDQQAVPDSGETIEGRDPDSNPSRSKPTGRRTRANLLSDNSFTRKTAWPVRLSAVSGKMFEDGSAA